MIPAPPPIVEQVASVHDGDTLTLASGTRIRLRAIDANELNGTCHTTCAARSAIEARDNLAKIALGRQATCVPTGMSYRRVVAWCSVAGVDLSCAQYRGGFAIYWRHYDPRKELCR